MEELNDGLSENGYPSEATIGDQSYRESRILPPSEVSCADKSESKEKMLRESIALKAYELFLRRGRVHGRDMEDWLTAERWVLARLKRFRKGG